MLNPRPSGYERLVNEIESSTSGNNERPRLGLASTQTLGPILDGLMRNTPDALDFIRTAAEQGVGAVVERDARFGDYSRAPSSQRPDPGHRVDPSLMPQPGRRLNAPV